MCRFQGGCWKGKVGGSQVWTGRDQDPLLSHLCAIQRWAAPVCCHLYCGYLMFPPSQIRAPRKRTHAPPVSLSQSLEVKHWDPPNLGALGSEGIVGTFAPLCCRGTVRVWGVFLSHGLTPEYWVIPVFQTRGLPPLGTLLPVVVLLSDGQVAMFCASVSPIFCPTLGLSAAVQKPPREQWTCPYLPNWPGSG